MTLYAVYLEVGDGVGVRVSRMRACAVTMKGLEEALCNRFPGWRMQIIGVGEATDKDIECVELVIRR